MSAGARVVQIGVSPGGVPEQPVASARVTAAAVMPGLCLRLGHEVIVQVTRYTAPCANIAASFRDRESARVSQKRHPGDSRVYARVPREGRLTSRDEVARLTDAEALALVGAR